MPKATLQAAPEQAEPPVNAAGVVARPGAMPDAPARHSRASMGLVPVHCERGLLLLEWSVDAASQRALADAQRAIRRVLRALRAQVRVGPATVVADSVIGAAAFEPQSRDV